MTATDFDPNRLSLAQCLERIQSAVERSRADFDGVVTSRDPGVPEVLDELAVDNVPRGFRKWQLPVYLPEASQLFVTVAEPGAKASRHSHDEGDGIRFIAGGSIIYEGLELVAGDWMFVPAGASYEFEVGRYGAVMCYCYCCCCA